MSQDDQDIVAELVDGMYNLMIDKDGIGLAATQVGVPLAVCITLTTNGKLLAFLNPVIISSSKGRHHDVEGCLSLPGVRAIVSRAFTIRVSYMDAHWKQHTSNFSGRLARILQHEIEHLDGKLFIDHLDAGQVARLPERVRNAIAQEKEQATHDEPQQAHA